MTLALLVGALPGEALAASACPPPPPPLGHHAAAKGRAAQLARELRRAERQLAAAKAGAKKARGKGAARRAAKRLAAARKRKAAARRVHQIRLVFDDTPAMLSFAKDRRLLDVPIVIKTARTLPRSVKASSLKVESLRDLRRVGDGLVSVPRVVPRVSSVHITNARDRIYFSVCVDGNGLDAGSYAGSVTVSGPNVLGHVDVPIAVNVKDADFFYKGVFLSLLVTLLFLFYKELRNADKRTLVAWWGDRGDWATLSRRARTRARRQFFLVQQSHFGLDFLVLECIVPIGASFAAMYGIYASTATWGADGIVQWFSLFTTAFTAAGVRSLIVTATPSPPDARLGRQASLGGGEPEPEPDPARPRPRPHGTGSRSGAVPPKPTPQQEVAAVAETEGTAAAVVMSAVERRRAAVRAARERQAEASSATEAKPKPPSRPKPVAKPKPKPAAPRPEERRRATAAGEEEPA